MAQSVQTLDDVPPMLVENLPALHDVHGALPVEDLYLPCSHNRQLPTLTVAPATHLHDIRESDATALNPHPEHVPLPGTFLNVVFEHRLHAPSTSVYPALHWQFCAPVPLPVPESEFGRTKAHSVHVPGPAVALNVALGQGRHSVEPAVSLYVPAAQAEHAVPSAPV